MAALCALAFQIAPGSPASRPVRADGVPVPKAVFIVGPTNGLTDSNLVDAEKMAQQAEAAGMEVHRVFFPHATWDNVLANIQDANLVVYMGHGYGWPSPYTKELTESRQDGMGLNSYDGSGKAEYTYYGATRIRESIRLAPNAIVFLNHLCYSAGNGEPGMAIPGVELARERVDNMASGWLAVGARAVFAYGWWQKLNYPQALMTGSATMDQLFMTVPSGSAAGSPAGYVGWNPSYHDSLRTPGATNHLDPHKSYGYYRAVTGSLDMTTADFRSTATGTLPPGAVDPNAPPEITSLKASDAGASTTSIAGSDPVSFHPNGDGLDEELVLTHTVTRAAHLDATVTDQSGQVVRSYSVWSAKGTSTSRWNGKNDAGVVAADGLYTLTYVPRDDAGLIGTPVSTQALVLTAVKLGMPAPAAFFARDADGLAKAVKIPVTLNQPAQVTWRIVGADGTTVRTVRSNAAMVAGTATYVWDGRADDRSWAPDGWYRSVVSATTSLGSYTEERKVYAGAFRIAPSTTSPARGAKLTLTIVSSEPLGASPRVRVTQPGFDTWEVATTQVSTRKYKATLTLKTGGDPGSLDLVVAGTDKNGGAQQTGLTLTLR